MRNCIRALLLALLLSSPSFFIGVSSLRAQSSRQAEEPAARLATGPRLSAEPRPISRQVVQYLGVRSYIWEPVVVGGGGRPTALAIHPKDPSVIYAATDGGGPMRWDSKEKYWIPLADRFGPEQAALYYAECLALDANNPDRVYYSAGRTGTSGKSSLLKSTNRGTSWTVVPLRNREGKEVSISDGRRNEGYTGKRLAVDPNKGMVLFYGSRREGLFKSADGGERWEQLTNFPEPNTAPDGIRIGFILFDARSGKNITNQTKTIYIQATFPDTARNGIYRSGDAGLTWKKMQDAPWGVGEVDVQGTLYVAGQGVKRWKGNDWEEITPDKSREYSAIAISPADPNLIVCIQGRRGIGNHLFRSSDGGRTWTKFSDDDFIDRGKRNIQAVMQPWQSATSAGGPGSAHIFDDPGALVFDGADPKKLWMTHQPGVWTCADITADSLQWRAEVEGHEAMRLLDVVSPSKGAPLLSGMMDLGGFRHTNVRQMPPLGLKALATVTSGRNATEDITDIDFCEADPNFVAATGAWNSPEAGGLEKSALSAAAGFSTDNGTTWQRFASLPFREARSGRIAVNATTPDNMVWIPCDTLNGDDKGNTPVYFTKNRGQNWQVAIGAPSGLVSGATGESAYAFSQPLEADRVRPDSFYIWDGRDGRFYRSDDGGTNWKHCATLPVQDSAQGGTSSSQYSLRAAPGIAGEVWAAADGKGLFRSSDGGENWTKLDGVERAWHFAWGFNREKEPVAYLLGKVRGDSIQQSVALYRSDDMGKSWRRLNEANQGWGQVSVMNGARQVAGRVYIGTNGRGIFYGEAGIVQTGLGMPGGGIGVSSASSSSSTVPGGGTGRIMGRGSGPPPCPTGENLLINDSAQMSPGTPAGTVLVRPIAGWQPYGGFTVKGVPQPNPINSFVGGADSQVSGASQRITMQPPCFPSIDNGQMHFLLKAELGGYKKEDDNAMVRATFWGRETDPSTGRTRPVYLGSAWIGPIKAIHRRDVTGSSKVGVTHIMPPGTRWVDVEITMQRTEGFYNEANVDNLMFMMLRGLPLAEVLSRKLTIQQPTPMQPYGFHFPYGSFNSSGWVLVLPDRLVDLFKPKTPAGNNTPPAP